MKKSNKCLKPPISNADYKRIFRIVYSVLKNEQDDLTKACFQINFCGASIIHRHYGLKAIPRVGAAAYCVHSTEPTVVAFLDVEDGKIDLDGKNEHCWLQIDDWHVDFMAPIFSELCRKRGFTDCPSRVFMKPCSQAKQDPADLLTAGDFFSFGNQDRTFQAVDALSAKPANEDLMSICSEWFEKPPKKLCPSIKIANEKGLVSNVLLRHPKIEGSWSFASG